MRLSPELKKEAAKFGITEGQLRRSIAIMKESGATNNHEGLVILGFTAKQLEVRQVLLEPGVTNYFHAARRLGITENAVKKRMSASYSMVSRARQVIKEDDDWKKARALAKKGIFPKEMTTPC